MPANERGLGDVIDIGDTRWVVYNRRTGIPFERVSKTTYPKQYPIPTSDLWSL
jgi:hypothetical protein